MLHPRRQNLPSPFGTAHPIAPRRRALASHNARLRLPAASRGAVQVNPTDLMLTPLGLNSRMPSVGDLLLSLLPVPLLMEAADKDAG